MVPLQPLELISLRERCFALAGELIASGATKTKDGYVPNLMTLATQMEAHILRDPPNVTKPVPGQPDPAHDTPVGRMRTAIREAMRAVENGPASPALTDAVVKLSQAMDAVNRWSPPEPKA